MSALTGGSVPTSNQLGRCRAVLKLRGLFAVDREDDPDKDAHMGIPANSRDVLYHTGLGQTG